MNKTWSIQLFILSKTIFFLKKRVQNVKLSDTIFVLLALNVTVPDSIRAKKKKKPNDINIKCLRLKAENVQWAKKNQPQRVMAPQFYSICKIHIVTLVKMYTACVMVWTQKGHVAKHVLVTSWCNRDTNNLKLGMVQWYSYFWFVLFINFIEWQ